MSFTQLIVINPCIENYTRYLQTFFVAAAGYAELYMFPVYFQACKDASAVRSGVYGIAMAILAPAAFTAGVLVKKTGRYRPQMFVGWAFMLVGFGLLSTVHANSSVGLPVGYVIILGVGAGSVMLSFRYQ